MSLDMEKAIAKYNTIMNYIGYEHNTIGTKFSEDTDNWNLRDMVAEIDYVLSTYYEDGHINYEMQFGTIDIQLNYIQETTMLKQFLDMYEPYIKKMICSAGHCSRFDN